MRALTVVAAFGLLLASSPTFAQTAPKPAAPAAPRPPAPAPRPAAPQTPAPRPAAAPGPQLPFPEGAKIAFIDRERLIGESIEGKAAGAKAKALNDKKVAELNEKSKQLQTAQQQLQTGGTVLNDAAREDLQHKIERLDTDLQRASQDAQKEQQEFEQSLLLEFDKKLRPVLNDVAQEKNLHAIFFFGEVGLAWINGGLDVTSDVIKKLDARK